MTPTLELINRLRQLINHAPDCDTDPYRADDEHDRALDDTRILLVENDSREAIDFCHSDARYEIRELITRLIDNEYARSFISTLALEMSLCPMHLVDYAICFDDDNAECAAIRSIFPDHDT